MMELLLSNPLARLDPHKQHGTRLDDQASEPLLDSSVGPIHTEGQLGMKEV